MRNRDFYLCIYFSKKHFESNWPCYYFCQLHKQQPKKYVINNNGLVRLRRARGMLYLLLYILGSKGVNIKSPQIRVQNTSEGNEFFSHFLSEVVTSHHHHEIWSSSDRRALQGPTRRQVAFSQDFRSSAENLLMTCWHARGCDQNFPSLISDSFQGPIKKLRLIRCCWFQWSH